MENLETLIEFILAEAERLHFDAKSQNMIRLAAEEILVNVISYAYSGADGTVEIGCEPAKEGGMTIEVTDKGVPFDPLALPEPDTTLPMEERGIGGLGIFMTRKVMDRVAYRRENDRNILTMYKKK